MDNNKLPEAFNQFKINYKQYNESVKEWEKAEKAYLNYLEQTESCGLCLRNKHCHVHNKKTP